MINKDEQPSTTASRYQLPRSWETLLLAFLSALIFGPVVWQMIDRIPSTDYVAHINFAREFAEQGSFVSVHVMYQALLLALVKIFSLSYNTAGWVCAIGFYFLTVVILYTLVLGRLPCQTWRTRLSAATLAFLLLNVAPFSLLLQPMDNFYLGYIGINILHNPTIVLLKPLALLLFVYTISLLKNPRHLTVRTLGYGVLLVSLSLLAKPNFVLSLLPALLLVIAYRLVRRQFHGLSAFTLAIVLPMVGLLALEYVIQFRFIDGAADTGILLAPQLAWQQLGFTPSQLACRFFLSILFPLAVYLFYLPDSRRDLCLNLAWLTFLLGAAQMYLFVETGERQSHGNFWWSAQIGLFINFVASTLFWLPYLRQRFGTREKLCATLFGLHALSGISYHALQFQAESMSDWW